MTGRIDRQAAFSGTRDVADGLRFDPEPLDHYLEKRLEGYAGPFSVKQFRGGQSNPTYLLTARNRKYVLRRKPPGRLLHSAHAIEREFRVMAALGKAGFPVPRVRLLCEDEAVVGTPFYVMDFACGRVIWEPSCPGLEPPERAAIYDSMNETLARLHGFDVESLGLAGFGKANGYVARQIARWSEQYRASATLGDERMDRLVDWLPGHVPKQSASALVHGDYRLDNLIVDDRRPQIVAVLDWELSTLGDPLADFTYHLMQWHMSPSPDGAGVGSLAGVDFDATGIPGVDPYVRAYCSRTGRDGIPDLDFYLAYNFFRMAAIFQGIAGRVRDGTAANENAATLASQVAPMAEAAWRFAERAGAVS